MKHERARPVLAVEGISKQFERGPAPVKALHPVTFHVDRGEFVALLGPSGSGKSTVLRIIGGLIKPDTGQVLFDGTPIRGPHTAIGMVFQQTNLMPWRTVLQNVLLPVQIAQRRIRPKDSEKARRLLASLGLADFVDAYPKHLSGGMAQRTVLARTLVQDPDLLLMDEPFGALDALTREQMNQDLNRLHEARRKTVLMVTHSIGEAVFLSDRVLILSERPGRIVDEVTVLLERPRTIDMMGSPEFGQMASRVRRGINRAVMTD